MRLVPLAVLVPFLLPRPASADPAVCLARAAEVQRACTARAMAVKSGEPTVVRTAPCARAYDEEERRCEAQMHAQKVADDQASNAARHEAQTRQAAERAELQALAQKANAWDAPGLETLSDADLAAVPSDARATMLRAEMLDRDLGGNGSPAEKREAALAELAGLVAAEQSCRADKKCMAARAARKAEEEFRATVVAPMCEADQGREQALKDIAQERANPSGVVDLRLLHRAGQDLQYFQGQLAYGAPAYVKVRHHAWPGWRKECPE